jgi:putative ABC transport system ATP-binding protein
MNIVSKPLLKAEKINFIVQDRETAILHDINLSILDGEFVVILGHNGSGKSTLIKILSGDIIPSSGLALLEEVPINTISAKIKAIDFITLSQVTENKLFTELTLSENIFLWESRFPKEQRLDPKQVISKAYSGDKLLDSLEQKLKNFSGGEKQAILLGLILAHPPRILFLDEHTSALDPKACREIMSITARQIEANKITTIMVTHSLEEALNYGTRIIIMQEGGVIVDHKKDGSLTIDELKKMMSM